MDAEAKLVGLEIHMGKTNIFKNGVGPCQNIKSMLLHHQQVDVLHCVVEMLCAGYWRCGTHTVDAGVESTRITGIASSRINLDASREWRAHRIQYVCRVACRARSAGGELW